MKFLSTGVLIFISISFHSCVSHSEIIKSPLSRDSIFISTKNDWREADLEVKQLIDGPKKIVALADVELFIFHNNSILLIRTSASKLANDSICLFWPPENGGEVFRGTMSKEFKIDSESPELKNQNIKWVDRSSIELNRTHYSKIDSTSIEWLEEVITKYSKFNSKDVGEIKISGP